MGTLNICSTMGCTRIGNGGRGKCQMHYLRMRRSGKFVGETRRERNLKFLNSCITSKTDECLYPNFSYSSEYPTLSWEGKDRIIGQIILELLIGPRPNGLEMRHLCGNAKCCNPRHLKWDTHIINCADKQIHGTEYDRRGERNPKVKLTKEQVAAIRKRHRKGRGPYDTGNSLELAKEFGVTRTNINGIIRGDIWQES